MAILPGFPGVSVEIHVGGNTLKEYDDSNEDEPTPTTVTKYIEAKTGAKFEIHFRFETNFQYRNHTIQCETYFDGSSKYVNGFVLNKEHLGRSQAYTTKQVGAFHKEGGRWTERKYMFSSLVTGMSLDLYIIGVTISY